MILMLCVCVSVFKKNLNAACHPIYSGRQTSYGRISLSSFATQYISSVFEGFGIIKWAIVTAILGFDGTFAR